MMDFSCVRPWAFYGLLAIVPAVIACRLYYGRLSGAVGSKRSPSFARMRRAVMCRTVCWSLAWCFLITAYAGVSWGTELIPVRRTGSSVSFVFDVSRSMTAKDVSSGAGAAVSKPVSRLDAVKLYAAALLDRMEGTEVSAVIAKGSGVVAVPLTSDLNAVRSLLPSLSPALLTSTGSSIGSGIEAAVNSFPPLSAAARTIVVFTDGEETDGRMSGAVADALKFGIPVVFVGFGSDTESEILAGDEKTTVKTALRTEALRNLVASAKTPRGAAVVFPDMQTARAFYLDSDAPGSALEVLDLVRKHAGTAEFSGFSYENRPIERFPLFCLLAVAFFLLGYVGAEFDVTRLKKKSRIPAASDSPKKRRNSAGLTGLLVLLVLSATGCSADWQSGADILESTFRWYRKEYREAVAGFMNVTETAELRHDETLKQYGLYGLAATYLMQGELDAALARLSELSDSAPDFIRFSAAYNAGVIAHRQGKYEQAAQAFRQALLIDSTNMNAKINLELSLRQEESSSSSGAVEMTPVSEQPRDSALENTIFSLIRENDQNRWKNQQSTDVSDSASDY